MYEDPTTNDQQAVDSGEFPLDHTEAVDDAIPAPEPTSAPEGALDADATMAFTTLIDVPHGDVLADDDVDGDTDAATSTSFWDGQPRGSEIPDTRGDLSYRRAGRPLGADLVENARGRRWVRWVVIGAAAVVAIGAIVLSVDAIATRGHIHRGVHVVGLDVGGMAPAEAAAAIDRQFAQTVAAPVTARIDSRTWPIDPASVGAAVDTSATVSDAYAVGRRGNVLRRIGERARLWFGTATIPVDVRVNDALLRAALDGIARDVRVEPRDAAVVVSGIDVRAEPAAVGIRMRDSVVRAAIMRAFVAKQRTVPVAVEFVPVSVTDQDVRQAVADARTILAGPVMLTYGAHSWVIQPQQMSTWLRFKAVPADEASAAVASTASVSQLASQSAGQGSASSVDTSGTAKSRRMTLVTYLAAEDVSATIGSLVAVAGKPAIDAKFIIKNGNVTITPSQVGMGLDAVALASTLRIVLTDPAQRRTATVRMTTTQPAITTAKAHAMGIKERISTYTTTYSAGNLPRVNNIKLLASNLDGKLVPPGGTFSFNGYMGERTAAKGYQEAPAIVDGKLVPQLGGGICQVGTTVFNTVFFAGFEVIERQNHSQYISHYPKGRDATVSWGGPDLKWRNDTNQWVLIKATATSSALTVSLWGTDPGYTVSYTTGPFTNITAPHTREIKDPTLSAGVRVVEEQGASGRKIVVTRTVRSGSRVVRTDKFVSTYRPVEEVVRVGTKVSSTDTTGTP